jgi:mannose-6-phosphate isomerase-like protein (cupin superfamily)
VITGRTPDDKSVFVRDEEAPGVAMEGVPRFRIDEVWANAGVPRLPADARTDAIAVRRTFFPAAGGTEFCVVTFPPAADLERAAASGADLAAAEKKFNAAFPGLADVMEPGAPGMHTTQTVDYGVVLHGRVTLELDDGAKKTLEAGDCVVQNGTRHAWRNESDRECVMAFVIVGATNG